MKRIMFSIIFLLILLSSVLAYLSPSIFGHSGDVVGAVINSQNYSLQDLIDSNYLAEKLFLNQQSPLSLIPLMN